MKTIELKETAITSMIESLDKASSVVDLVRLQLEAIHDNGGSVMGSASVVTTHFQLAVLLETVDTILMERSGWCQEVLGITER
jgi:hypothetical protein